MSVPRRELPSMSVKEAAVVLNVSPMATYRLVNSGELVAYRIGRTIRVYPDDIDQYLRDARITPREDTA